jgi:predicted esterase
MSAVGLTRFNGSTVVEFAPAARLLDSRYVKSWSFNTTLAFGPGLWFEQSVPINPDIPVLVAAGDRDECFVAPLYPAAFRSIAPHAEICSMGPIGHWDLLVDTKMLATVERWLAQQDAGQHLPIVAALKVSTH